MTDKYTDRVRPDEKAVIRERLGELDSEEWYTVEEVAENLNIDLETEADDE